jgi:V8-like Glu-specific endopeptidase
MKIPRELIDRAEASLTFDPRARRRALLERAPATEAEPAVVQRRLAHALGEGPPGSGAADLSIERVLYGGDHLNVSFLERGMTAADAVARIEVCDEEGRVAGHGTGFMVSPRLLLTNHHVLGTAESAASSWVDFRHELDALGRPVEATTFALDPLAFFFTDPELDCTVIAVAPTTPDGSIPVATFGWLRLSSSDDLALPGEWLSLVHHPAGRGKQVSLRQNLLIGQAEGLLWYASEAAAGSSGAPVFNDAWQVVALHCLGAPERDRAGEILTLDGSAWTPSTDESEIVWRATMGTRASTLVRRLREACGDHPMVRELLAEGSADAAEAVVLPLGSGVSVAANRSPVEGLVVASSRIDVAPHLGASEGSANGNGTGAHAQSNESITITVPLRITVRPGETGGRRPEVGVNLS